MVRCLKSATDMETFDDLRLAAFDSNALKLDFEKTACTSTNHVRKHIKRSYYQLQLWVQAPFRDACLTLNAVCYGYVRRNGSLVPEIVVSKPTGLQILARVARAHARMRVPAGKLVSTAVNTANARELAAAKKHH